MLSSLHIRNFVLIDSLDVKFPEGLVIITGQTGAGKSILLGALGLLAGAKADASMVSEGAESCVVEGEFDTPEGLRIIRRVIYSSGRSRSFIDDCPVQLPELAELGGRLFDIHSQHQSLLLTDKGFQLELLDRFIGAEQPLAQCRSTWDELCRCRRELEELRTKLNRSRAEADYDEAQLRELESASLREGELEELEAEQLTLGNAEQILEQLGAASALLSGDEGSSPSGQIRNAGKTLAHLDKYLPGMSELAERLDSVRIELDDISAEVESAASRIESSPGRLEQVENRLSLLYRLMQKHGCRTCEELIAVRESYRGKVSGGEGMEEQCAELEQKLASLQKAHDGLCASLHSLRIGGAKDFAGEVTAKLKYLELERAVFEVSVEPGAPGANGADSISFRFSADGSRSIDIAKCASGGELSRIMLSLKAMMARFSGMPTLIFDEIDTGVSGSVADKMGRMICEMGRSMQVFSITHLPQVAAKGNAHYVVSKSYDPGTGRTRSSIRLVEGEERQGEIARLLSGETITAEALANAGALLKGN